MNDVRKTLLFCCLALMLVLPTASGYADDITDSIQEALEYYKEGQYSDAVESLNYASQLIQQNKAENMGSLLPDALPGWTAEAASSQAAGAAMFGGGVTAERTYTKDGGRITIQIITDSPVMQSMMMMFTNPMFAASDGGKLEKIGRQKAIVKYAPEDRQGDIKLVIENRFFVSIEGSDVSKEDLTAYAEAIDYKKFSKMP